GVPRSAPGRPGGRATARAASAGARQGRDKAGAQPRRSCRSPGDDIHHWYAHRRGNRPALGRSPSGPRRGNGLRDGHGRLGPRSAFLAALRADPEAGPLLGPRRLGRGKGATKPVHNPVDLADLLETTFTTGMRIGEATGLRWGDLHLVPGEGTASVTGTVGWVRDRRSSQRSGPTRRPGHCSGRVGWGAARARQSRCTTP